MDVTLVSRGVHTPYSGMLPGLVAGHYRHEEAHIDLVRLCAATDTRFVNAVAVGLDRAGKRVLLDGGGAVEYDLVSLDVGITPDLAAIGGAAEHGIAVKPIERCIARTEALVAAAMKPHGPKRIAVIGGGAGGVELLLSLRHRVRGQAVKEGHDSERFAFLLVTAGRVLETHGRAVQAAFRRILAARGIGLHESSPVVAIAPGGVNLADGTTLAADAVLVTTHAAAPGWFAGTGLALDGRGFVAVGPTLQSLNDPAVLAAGDCAALVETPREKSGVYAVRAGPPLARNLLALARGEAPVPWRPQRRALALIGTGDRHVVASWGPFKAEGRWAWHWKDRIDRRWIGKYQM